MAGEPTANNTISAATNDKPLQNTVVIILIPTLNFQFEARARIGREFNNSELRTQVCPLLSVAEFSIRNRSAENHQACMVPCVSATNAVPLTRKRSMTLSRSRPTALLAQ